MKRACTCGAWTREKSGLKPLTGVVFHFRDCAALLPDPDTCEHKTAVRRNKYLFCGACGKGLSEDGPAWIRAEYAPGYGEKLLKAQVEAKKKKQAQQDRERTYDLSGIYLDLGITDLDDEELKRLIDCCQRELKYRAQAQANPA